MEKINGVVLRGDKYKSMKPLLFKWFRNEKNLLEKDDDGGS